MADCPKETDKTMLVRSSAQHDMDCTSNIGPRMFAQKDSLLFFIVKDIMTKHGILVGFST